MIEADAGPPVAKAARDKKAASRPAFGERSTYAMDVEPASNAAGRCRERALMDGLRTRGTGPLLGRALAGDEVMDAAPSGVQPACRELLSGLAGLVQAALPPLLELGLASAAGHEVALGVLA